MVPNIIASFYTLGIEFQIRSHFYDRKIKTNKWKYFTYECPKSIIEILFSNEIKTAFSSLLFAGTSL